MVAADRDVSGYEAISIRVAQKEASPHDAAGQPQNLRVALRDTAGKERAVRVAAFGEIPYPDQRADPLLRKSAMSTIRIPLTSFTIVAAGADHVDLENIERVELRFTEKPAGEIDIDTVQFTA